MTSLDKYRANRRNALKSTGPRSDLGKKRASVNARCHGLSVPLPPAVLAPLQNQVADLMAADGIEREAALDLAEKIIEWERNRTHERMHHGAPVGNETEGSGEALAELPPLDKLSPAGHKRFLQILMKMLSSKPE